MNAGVWIVHVHSTRDRGRLLAHVGVGIGGRTLTLRFTETETRLCRLSQEWTPAAPHRHPTPDEITAFWRALAVLIDKANATLARDLRYSDPATKETPP